MKKLLVLFALAFLALAAPSLAATIEVTTESEDGPGSLGQAILDAEPGDEIRIPAGAYLLTNGDVLEEKDLSLVGAGDAQTTVEPGGGGDAFDDPGVSTSNLAIGEPRNPEGDDGSDAKIETKAQIVAVIATLGIFLLVLELVRRRRLVERYALLWMTAALALLVLSIWTDGLEVLADAMGIQEPANAIFILAFAVGFLLLLNFSVASSRLSEETKILAQEVARLDEELSRERGRGTTPASPAADERGDDAPIAAQNRGEQA